MRFWIQATLSSNSEQTSHYQLCSEGAGVEHTRAITPTPGLAVFKLAFTPNPPSQLWPGFSLTLALLLGTASGDHHGKQQDQSSL